MDSIKKEIKELEERQHKLTKDVAYMEGMNDLYKAVKGQVSESTLFVLAMARVELIKKLNG